ncbi:hypothetical protein ACO0LO_23980 [Undibacterium sp. TJN25]|uniref:hypothetical protein n=1 Tax=Undibacterium sp. TJN25 TaxID=3413056 RepID=UPI003BF4010B
MTIFSPSYCHDVCAGGIPVHRLGQINLMKPVRDKANYGKDRFPCLYVDTLSAAITILLHAPN